MYETILVGTDGSDTASVAVDHAAELAAKFDGRLVIVGAFRPPPSTEVEAQRRDVPDDVAWAVNGREQVEATLTEAKERAEGHGATDVMTTSVEGPPSEVLLDTADKLKASVIVVGSVGLTGAKRFLIGSVPNRITHHASVDVLVVRTT